MRHEVRIIGVECGTRSMQSRAVVLSPGCTLESSGWLWTPTDAWAPSPEILWSLVRDSDGSEGVLKAPNEFWCAAQVEKHWSQGLYILVNSKDIYHLKLLGIMMMIFFFYAADRFRLRFLSARQTNLLSDFFHSHNTRLSRHLWKWRPVSCVHVGCLGRIGAVTGGCILVGKGIGVFFLSTIAFSAIWKPVLGPH